MAFSIAFSICILAGYLYVGYQEYIRGGFGVSEPMQIKKLTALDEVHFTSRIFDVKNIKGHPHE